MSVIPSCPVQQFFCCLVEDYADEWLWRPALYYRWEFEEDSQMNATRFVHEFLQYPLLPSWVLKNFAIFRQYREYVYGDGLRSPDAKKHTEALYLTTLSQLEEHFKKTPFLLGERPTLADFGFMGPMFRHFGIDPTPAKLMRLHAPAVYEWVARMWNSPNLEDIDPKFAFHPAGSIPETWIPILHQVGHEYLPYLHTNSTAIRDGKKNFDFVVDGVTYESLPVNTFRAWCRERLQQRYQELDQKSAETVRKILEQTGCWEPLFRDGMIPSQLPNVDEYPVCKKRKPFSLLQSLGYRLNLPAWDYPAYPREDE